MQGDVFIEDDRITVVEPSADHAQEGWEIIDAAGMIVMPGLVDDHRHLWQTPLRGLAADLTAPGYRGDIRGRFGPHYTPEDLHIATLAGALDAIDSGVTTIGDFAHIMNGPEFADKSMDALRQSGIRVVFGYGTPTDADSDAWYKHSSFGHSEDIGRVVEDARKKGGQVGVMMAARAPYLMTDEVVRHDFGLARELGIRIHIDGGLGGGVWGGVRHYPIRQYEELGLLGPDVTYVHCNNLAEDEYAAIAQSGGHVSVSPIAELNVGHGIPAIAPLLAAGVRPSLSGDYVTQAGGDMFGVMRMALSVSRGVQGRDAFNAMRGIDEWDLHVGDMLDFATAGGAASLGHGSEIGRLAPGMQADIVLIDARSLRLMPMNDPVATIVMQATPGDVDTVMIGGRILKQDGRLTNPDLDEIIGRLADCRNRLFERAGVSLGGRFAEGKRSSWEW